MQLESKLFSKYTFIYIIEGRLVFEIYWNIEIPRDVFHWNLNALWMQFIFIFYSWKHRLSHTARAWKRIIESLYLLQLWDSLCFSDCLSR